VLIVVLAGSIALAVVLAATVVIVLVTRHKGGEGGGINGPVAAASSGAPSAQPSTSDAAALSPKLVDALRFTGYACYMPTTQPVTIYSCYAEPGTNLNRRIIRIHPNPAGKMSVSWSTSDSRRIPPLPGPSSTTQ
jgi:hypothetical protein